MTAYVYIMSSQRKGTLYVGVTSDLIRRVYEHKHQIVKGFTSRYNVSMLVYYECFSDIRDAIEREKRLKKFYRKEKIALIENMNKDWIDLYYGLL